MDRQLLSGPPSGTLVLGLGIGIQWDNNLISRDLRLTFPSSPIRVGWRNNVSGSLFVPKSMGLRVRQLVKTFSFWSGCLYRVKVLCVCPEGRLEGLTPESQGNLYNMSTVSSWLVPFSRTVLFSER